MGGTNNSNPSPSSEESVSRAKIATDQEENEMRNGAATADIGRFDISETIRWLGYKPAYSLANLLSELDTFGDSGPPRFTATKEAHAPPQ